jgi:putative transposase
MKKAESHLNISQLCQHMNVPIASYYYHPTDKLETAQYLYKMKVIHKENFQAYGRRRMRVELNNQVIQIGVFKITKLMKAADIIAKVPKKPHHYPSGKQRPSIPNQLNRQFNPSQANTYWVGDITDIRHHGS